MIALFSKAIIGVLFYLKLVCVKWNIVVFTYICTSCTFGRSFIIITASTLFGLVVWRGN